ncbi:MAG: GntR family transcriptional regulator [Anaerolineae bacterium]|jgi:GntR family transcriptional regulator
MKLEQEGPEPLYQQIRRILTGWIEDGKLKAHDRIPSERELCERFNVSRMTVRQALAKLKEDDLIYTQQGKGAFVSERNSPFRLSFVLTGYSEESSPRAWPLASRFLDSRVIAASPELADAMHIAPGDEVVRVERLRVLRDTPIARQTVHVPHRFCPGLADQEFKAEGVLDTIWREYQLRPFHARQSVTASLTSAQDMQLLQLSAPLPMLILERTSFLANGTPIELSNSAYRADFFNLLLTLDLSRWFT